MVDFGNRLRHAYHQSIQQ